MAEDISYRTPLYQVQHMTAQLNALEFTTLGSVSEKNYGNSLRDKTLWALEQVDVLFSCDAAADTIERMLAVARKFYKSTMAFYKSASSMADRIHYMERRKEEVMKTAVNHGNLNAFKSGAELAIGAMELIAPMCNMPGIVQVTEDDELIEHATWASELSVAWPVVATVDVARLNTVLYRIAPPEYSTTLRVGFDACELICAKYILAIDKWLSARTKLDRKTKSQGGVDGYVSESLRDIVAFNELTETLDNRLRRCEAKLGLPPYNPRLTEVPLAGNQEA